MKPVKLFDIDKEVFCDLHDTLEVGMNEHGLYLDVCIGGFESDSCQTFTLSPKQVEKIYQEMFNAGLIGLHVPTKHYVPTIKELS